MIAASSYNTKSSCTSGYLKCMKQVEGLIQTSASIRAVWSDT